VEELLDMANKLPANEVQDIYAICDINHLMHRWTDQLSGGEKQRISLALKLSTSPKLILLDEPYSNLDLLHKRQMKNVVEQLGDKMGISCILVSHDAADILSWADTVFFMKEGRIMQRGSAMDLYNKPLNEYCGALLGAYNLLTNEMPGLPAYEDKSTTKLFFRPENIRITAPGDSPIAGVVEKILYWGSYYTIDVKVAEDLITVQTNTHQLKTGDRVGLFFTTEPHRM
jgi:ABC-type sugar transport system ATPase subunit